MGAHDQNEIFLLPEEGDTYLLYGPLIGLLARVNASAARQLHTYLKVRDPAVVSPSVAATIGGLDRLADGRSPLPLDRERAFAPDALTIFPTNRCNLRCVYCYAEAGTQPRCEIDPGFCEAAIDLLADRLDGKSGPRSINFHGGGEPTMNWPAVVHCVDYSRRRFGKQVRFGMATNGVLTPAQIDYLAMHFGNINVSLDGPPDIQDRQRPLADGSGSFDAVMATLEEFRRRDTVFSLRATVTAASVGRMREIVEFLIQRAGCRVIALEPAHACGRCHISGCHAPNAKQFAEGFMKAFEYGQTRGTQIRYSGARIGPAVNSFCGVCRDSFSITPDGFVTSCFEVFHRDHPLASLFHYGQFNPRMRRIEIDVERLHRLRDLLVTNRRFCDDCFCRWHCAGDCQAKVKAMEIGDGSTADRCRMTQTITQQMLSALLDTDTGRAMPLPGREGRPPEDPAEG